MTNITDHLKASYSGLSLDEALQSPVSALLGVNDSAAAALKRVGVETIFDLGSSWLFANANAALEAVTGEPLRSRTELLKELPAGQPDDAASLPLESLRGLSVDDAAAIKQALALTTVREFALWPPRGVATALVSEAAGAPTDQEETYAEELRPQLGEFPTERVYYNSLVMLGMGATAGQQPLTGTISLGPAVTNPGGFGHPAVGALVTLSQSWYAKGITLGHMLHSLALAPGEATRIAVIDWSRRTRAVTSETIAESESLDNATEHSRAISEVQNAVADEMQSGGSMSSGWAKSTSGGNSGGFSIAGGIAGALGGITGALGFGGGEASSSQQSETNTRASSTSWSIGNRSVMAEMAQHVNDRTEQHATSVRNRRASAVREVSQSEHEEVSTRVVANYNHMHALTVQYYEVVQIYRVLVQMHSVQRALFLPFELLDFSGAAAADVVARFRGQLLAAALTERAAALLIDDRGEVEVRAAVLAELPLLFVDVVRGNLATTANLGRFGAISGGNGAAPAAAQPGLITGTLHTPSSSTAGAVLTGTSSTAGTVLTAPPPPTIRRISSPGPLLASVPGDAELVAVSFDGVRVDRVRLDQVGVPAESSTFAVPNTTFQVDFPGGRPLRNITAIHVNKSEADADSGSMTLHYRSANRQKTLPVPLDLAAGTSMQKVAFLAADQSNRRDELMAHLQANRAYYSQAVLANLDSATLAMLLSRFTWKNKPLADQVEPTPLAVAGNFLVLRAPVDDSEVAGIDANDIKWGELLKQRSLTIDQRDDRLVPIPTGGVFAEAVLGRSNCAEKLDITRFWNWQDSPIPLAPPEIAPVSTGSRATAEDLKPGQLSTPVLNITTPTALPEPAGLTAALNTLASGSLFRDMSGLAGTQALAEAGSAGTLSAATEAGRIASANLKTVSDQATAMGQTAADMWKTLQTKKGDGGSGSNISTEGARINHGRDMDERGVTGGASSKKSTDEMPPLDKSGLAPFLSDSSNPKRESAYADTAATGLSPDFFGLLSDKLGVGVQMADAITPAKTPAAFKPTQRELDILKQIHDDIEASQPGSLKHVNLHPMREHKNAKYFKGVFQAWTDTATDVYYDTDDYDSDVKADKGDDTRARMTAIVAIRHELVHVARFGTQGRPKDFREMVDFELEAYGCPTPSTSTTPALKWLNDTTSTGAAAFLATLFSIVPADAQQFVVGNVSQFATGCNTVLNSLKALTSSPEHLKTIKRELINHKFLPPALATGAGYKINDLYK
jgi:hypothetical protein